MPNWPEKNMQKDFYSLEVLDLEPEHSHLTAGLFIPSTAWDDYGRLWVGKGRKERRAQGRGSGSCREHKRFPLAE
jgi:hypothetical protein